MGAAVTPPGFTHGTPGADDRIRAALRSHPPHAAAIIDFDETLWLRNSTEEYLRSLRPRFLAYLILLALDLLRPWRFIGGRGREHAYRDWLRVLVCTVLLPWSLALWRRRAPELAAGWRNDALIGLLDEAGVGPLRVATLGTDVVVAPLLAQIDPRATLLAAGTLWGGFRIRLLGKRRWIEARHGDAVLPDALVVTDSEADTDLLERCRTPLLVRWPKAEYRPALSDAYVPFLYTQRGKRPGEKYMLYGVLLEDVVLLSLALAWTMPAPLAGTLGLLLLHLSFWTIYEIGYAENDTLAIRREAAPKVWEEAGPYAARIRPVQAGWAALILGAAGAGLLVAFNTPSLHFSTRIERSWPLFAAVLGTWIGYLACARGAYWLYNRLEVGARGYFYVVLQLFRTLGYAVLLDLNAAGAAILLSLVLARWVKYLVYRDLGVTMSEDQRFLTLLLFLVLACSGIAVEGSDFLGFQILVALVWLATYAHRRLRAVTGWGGRRPIAGARGG